MAFSQMSVWLAYLLPILLVMLHLEPIHGFTATDMHGTHDHLVHESLREHTTPEEWAHLFPRHDETIPFGHCFTPLSKNISEYYSFVFWEYTKQSEKGIHNEHLRAVTELIELYYMTMQADLLILSNTMDMKQEHADVIRYDSSCFKVFKLPLAMADVKQGNEGNKINTVIDGQPVVRTAMTSIIEEGDIARVAFNQLYDVVYHDLDIIWLQPDFLLSRPRNVVLSTIKKNEWGEMDTWIMNGVFNLHNTELLDCVLMPKGAHELEAVMTPKHDPKHEFNEFGAERMNACWQGLGLTDELVYNISASYKPKYEGPIYSLLREPYLCRNAIYQGWKKFKNLETATQKCLPPRELLNTCEALHLSMKHWLAHDTGAAKECNLTQLVLYHKQLIPGVPTNAGPPKNRAIMVLHDLPTLTRAVQFGKHERNAIASDVNETSVLDQVSSDELNLTGVVRSHGDKQYTLPDPNWFSSYNGNSTPSLYAESMHLFLCAISKTGSTKMKQLFNCLYDGEKCHEKNLASFHAKRAFHDTGVTFPSDKTLHELLIIFNSVEVDKVVVVRHPLTKLLSAYLMFHDQGRAAKLIPNRINEHVKFPEFVAHLKTQMHNRNSWNIHWKPQFLQCQFDYVFNAYKLIRFEHLEDDVLAIFENNTLLKPHIDTVRSVFATEFGHTEHADSKYAEYYTTPELKQDVATIFEEDMELFGYTIEQLETPTSH